MNKEEKIQNEPETLIEKVEEQKGLEKNFAGRIKKWFIKNASRPIAEKGLYFVSFVDSFISPLPPDIFLGALSAINPKKWFRYAIGTAIWGVVGGLVGYLIGYALFESVGEKLIDFYHFHEELANLSQVFDRQAFLSIFIAAVTPIPYQIFTVTAGLFKINIIIFVLASIIGRTMRFVLVAWIMKTVGEKFGNLILKYFNWLLLLAGLLILVYILFL